MRIKITQALIQQARQTNLYNYLSSKGYQIEEDGRAILKFTGEQRYRVIVDDSNSLVITKNAFFWNSRSINGNAIDLLTKGFGYSFEDALAELTNHSYTTSYSSAERQTAGRIVNDTKKELAPTREQTPFVLPDAYTDTKRTFAYLTQTRCIHSNIIQRLVKDNLLAEDERHNAMFIWKNEDGVDVGAELHGTLTYTKFKGIARNSDARYGFSIVPRGTPSSVIFFESAIDLVSYWSLNLNITDTLLVSMSGLKEVTIRSTMSRIGQAVGLSLGIDNGETTRDFIKAVTSQFEAVELLLPPVNFKDWNEVLQDRKRNSQRGVMI